MHVLSLREILATNNSIIFLYFFSIPYLSPKEVVLGWWSLMKYSAHVDEGPCSGFVHAGPSTQPPIDMSENFLPHGSAESLLNQSRTPQKIQNFMTSPYTIFSNYPIFCPKMPYFGALGVLDWNPYIFVTWEPIKEFGTLWWALLGYIGILISL